MEFLKKLIIVLFILISLVVAINYLILLKNSVTSGRYQEYWREESLNIGRTTIAIIGDSTGIGVGASSPENSFAWRVKEALELSGDKVRIVNLSTYNAKIRDVIVRQIPLLWDYYPDKIIISVGRKDIDDNDFDEDRFDELFSSLPSTRVYMLEVAASYNNNTDTNIQIFNSYLRDKAHDYGINVIPLYSATNLFKYDLTYYDWDFYHPNDSGYKVWAKEIIKAL